MPHRALRDKVQELDIRGVHFFCFKSEDDNLLWLLKNLFIKSHKYKRNRFLIKSIIKKVNPDIVHVIGAENPYYSYAAMDVSTKIPLVVSLQTLMSESGFYDNYNIDRKSYLFRSRLEQDIIKRCDYIASPVIQFKEYVQEKIKSNAIFLKMPLAVGVSIDIASCDKEFDFVYFAADISKAADYAVEAFAEAHKIHPDIKLNVSGGYTPEYKKEIDELITRLGINDSVFFTGSKDTHDEVIKQIKKSRFALLPLKVDLVSGTIREAMACGLPVVTTITPATPDLNKNKECVLLSEKGDYKAMADNMIRLIEDEEGTDVVRNNALSLIQEMHSNEKDMIKWRAGYYEIVDNFNNGTPFSDDLLL